MGRVYILVQCADKQPKGQSFVLGEALIDSWHPAIGKAVLKNWGMSEAVCEAVGAQAEAYAVKTNNATLTDVLVIGIRLAKRMKSYSDETSLSAGGVLGAPQPVNRGLQQLGQRGCRRRQGARTRLAHIIPFKTVLEALAPDSILL